MATIYIVPFMVYGLGSAVAGLKPPESASPARFLVSVLVSKVGTAITFVLIFYFTRQELSSRWVLYASVWWLMFIIGEIGQAIGPHYSWKEAVAGIISETIYWPVSALVTNWMIGIKWERDQEEQGRSPVKPGKVKKNRQPGADLPE